MEENKKEPIVVFVSGNVDLTDKQFMDYYMYQLAEVAKNEEYHFNISDDNGCSAMTQLLLEKTIKNKNQVSVYCIGNDPVNYVNPEFLLFSGFRTIEERNAAMTLSSTTDYHVVIPGKGRGAVEDNIIRRNEPEYNYMKHYLSGNVGFWQLFFNDNNLIENDSDAAEA